MKTVPLYHIIHNGVSSQNLMIQFSTWAFSNHALSSKALVFWSLWFRYCKSRIILIFSILKILPCHFHHLIAAILYIPVQQATIAAFHSRLDLSLPFLLWSCHRHIHFVVKDVFLMTVPCHCSTSSNSLLSKPAFHSPVLFSISVKRHEHAY